MAKTENISTPILWVCVTVGNSSANVDAENAILCICICVTIDAMLNFDDDIDTNADVKCEQSIILGMGCDCDSKKTQSHFAPCERALTLTET